MWKIYAVVAASACSVSVDTECSAAVRISVTVGADFTMPANFLPLHERKC